MTRFQREIFAQGLIELANIVAGALVFGQFIAGKPLDNGTVALGIIFTLTFYLAAYGFSKDARGEAGK
jgi:hypothetical protein